MPEVILLDYFYGDESEQFSYYRLPRLLVTGQRFKNLSTDAKLLYGLLLDRMSLSAKHGWYDEQGRVYIYYTLEEIRSKEARNYYEKLLAVKKQIRALNNKLDDLRMAWHKAGAAKREQLKPTILAAEAQLNDCLSQLDPLEKNARNSELIYLKKKS